jgi:RimJ/RimL family protein N-acetyltransferase
VFEIVTERLRLRPFRADDLPAFVTYRSAVSRSVSLASGCSSPPSTGVLFGDHGIHRVYAETDDRNLAVHRLFERLGFRCEARLVEADWFKGEWTTLRVYAVLRREWAIRHSAPHRS